MIILYNKLGNVELLYNSAHKLSLWEICKNTLMTEAIYANAEHKIILACISILWNVGLIPTSCTSEVNVTDVVVAPRIAIGSLIGALQKAITNGLTNQEMVCLVSSGDEKTYKHFFNKCKPEPIRGML